MIGGDIRRNGVGSIVAAGARTNTAPWRLRSRCADKLLMQAGLGSALSHGSRAPCHFRM